MLAVNDSVEEFGPYLVYEKLGVGGMATVHRAESRSVGGFRKAVALKRLLPHIAGDPEAVQAFVREARLASKLRHANIAQTYDLGKIGGVYYIAMELVPGPTFTQLMNQCHEAAGAIPLPISVNMLSQICEALDYAHNLCDEDGKPLGIIHRDVSPPNVVVSNTGVVKLIDFGIAKLANQEQHTVAGIIKGKFAYVAPEYTAGRLDHRADLFGLGVIAHELLTGRRLFHGETDLETVQNIREMPIQPPSRWNPQITRDFDDIILTALQRDPDRRWQSAAAMRNALDGVAKEIGVNITYQQVFDWVEWAFSQEPRRDDSKLARLIDDLEPSVSVEMPVPGGKAKPADKAKPKAKPAVWNTPIPTKKKRDKSQTAGTVRAKIKTDPSGVVTKVATPKQAKLPYAKRSHMSVLLLALLLVLVAVGAYVWWFGVPSLYNF
jgi:eukaryotic-like serine/threonine-protein kinase